MKRSEILGEILKLDINEARHLLTEARECLEIRSRNSVRSGQKVRFKSRDGIFIEGTVQRVNRKNVLVTSKMDRYGRDGQGIVSWTVSPGLLEVIA